MKQLIATPAEVRGTRDGTVTLLLRSIKDLPSGARYLGYCEGLFDFEYLDGSRGMACRRGYRCPWRVGDVVAVKETWATILPDLDVVSLRECIIEYRADTDADYPGDWPTEEARGNPEAPKWRSATTMPVWAVRTHVRVTSVACQQLITLSAAQAVLAGYSDLDELLDAWATKHRDAWRRMWIWTIGVEKQ